MGELSRREVLIGAGALSGAVALGALGSPAVAVGGRDGPDDFDAEVPTAWFDVARTLVQSTPGFTPPVAARAFGYTGIALYESVVARLASTPVAGQGAPRPAPLPRRNGDLHWAAVANSALASILRSLFPTTSDANKAAIDSLESSFADRFRSRSSRSTHRRSIEHGRDVARAVFDWSRARRRPRGIPPQLPTGVRAAGRPRPVGPDPTRRSSPHCSRAGAPTGASPSTTATSCAPGDRTPYSEDEQSAVLRRGSRGVRRGQQPRRRA